VVKEGELSCVHLLYDMRVLWRYIRGKKQSPPCLNECDVLGEGISLPGVPGFDSGKDPPSHGNAPGDAVGRLHEAHAASTATRIARRKALGTPSFLFPSSLPLPSSSDRHARGEAQGLRLTVRTASSSMCPTRRWQIFGLMR
jgi:hypothetical protein